jgi:hypothetical protein
LTALRHAGGARPEAVRTIGQAWQTLQQELDTSVALGGGPVPRRQVLVEWLHAIAFHNTREFKDSYGHFLERWGRAAEAMAAELAETTAQAAAGRARRLGVGRASSPATSPAVRSRDGRYALVEATVRRVRRQCEI